jgi:DNA mismatch repair protein MutS
MSSDPLDEGRSVIAALQSRYAQEASVTGLKIKHNNVLGYFIEVTVTIRKNAGRATVRNIIHRHNGQPSSFTTVELSLRHGFWNGGRCLEIVRLPIPA